MNDLINNTIQQIKDFAGDFANVESVIFRDGNLVRRSASGVETVIPLGVFTETDPTVPSYVKSITTTNISNWNTAFGWGNHAIAGYLTSATLQQVTNAGSVTTNSITVGGLTTSGNIVFSAYNRTIGSASYPASAIYTGELYSMLNIRSGGNTNGLSFYDNGGTLQMRIWGTGNVTINSATDAGYKLDVNGTVRAVNDITTNGAFVVTSTSLSGSVKYFNIIRSTDNFNPFYITSDKVFMHGVFFQLGGQGGGTIYSSNSVGGASTYITMSGPAYYNPTSGIAGTFAVTGQSFMASGNATFNTLTVAPIINNTGTYSGIFRGFYYNPTLTSLTGTIHRSIETTSGDVILNTQSASVNSGYTTVAVGGSSGVYFQMYVGANPTAQTLRGQIWAVGNNLLFNNPSAGYLGLYTTLYSGITIFPTTGNVHVGTSATDAGYKLDIGGTARIQQALDLGSTGTSGTINFRRAGDGGITSQIFQTDNVLRINNYQGTGIEFLVDNVNYFHVRGFANQYAARVMGNLTAVSGLSTALIVNNQISAAANNDVLVGLEIAPTFSNGAFTGVQNVDLRTKNAGVVIGSGYGYGANYGYANDGIFQIIDGGTTSALSGGSYATQIWLRPAGNSGGGNSNYWSTIEHSFAGLFINSGRYASNLTLKAGRSGSSGNIYFNNAGGTMAMLFGGTGNMTIGSTTDAGYKLDVNGTGRFFGGLTLANGTIVLSDIGGNRTMTTSGLTINYGASYSFSITGTNTASITPTADLTLKGVVHTYSATEVYKVQKTTNVGHLQITFDISGSDAVAANNYGTKSGNVRIYPGEQSFSNGYGNVILGHNGTAARGNVLIGTSTDGGYKLDVNGTTRVTSLYTADIYPVSSSISLWVNSLNAASRFYTAPVHPDGRINLNAVCGANDQVIIRAWHTSGFGLGTGSSANGGALTIRGDSLLVGTSGSLYFMAGTFGPLNTPYRLGIATNATVTSFSSGVINNTTNIESHAFEFTAKSHTFFTGTTAGNQTYPNQYTPLFLSTGGNVVVGGATDAGYKLDVVGGDARFNGVRVGIGAGGITTNTIVGNGALSANTTGAANVSFGENTLNQNTTGRRNVAIGAGALYGNIEASNSVAIGWNSMAVSDTGNNTAVGYRTLNSNTTGTNNAAFGMDALLFNTVGNNNTAVGVSTDSGDFSGSILLGMGAIATGNNQFVVGSASVNAGIVDTATVTATKRWQVKINGVDYYIALEPVPLT